MTIDDVILQLQCAGYTEAEIEDLFICAVNWNTKFDKGLIQLAFIEQADIIIFGDKIYKDKTGYLKGETV